MNEETTAIVPAQQMGDLAQVGDRGLQIRTMGDMVAFATKVAESKLAPKGMDTPEKCLVAMQAGMEAGLSPMRSLQSLIVINGTVSWKGDAALNLVRASGKVEFISWEYVGNNDTYACVVKSRRVGNPNALETSFSIRDAKRALLWGKAGPWSTYPQRMLYYRALGFHLRDFYGDILSGMTIAEETQDIPVRQAMTERQPPTQSTDPLLQMAGPQDQAAGHDPIEADFTIVEEPITTEPASEPEEGPQA